MAQCRRDLGEHEHYIAEFYYKTKRYQAALERFQVLRAGISRVSQEAEVKERIAECQKIWPLPKRKPKSGFFANLFDARW